MCSCAHSCLLPPSSLHPAAPPHRCPAAPPAGNIFEGDWKEGKPQLKDTKSKDWANLLPWLNETVTLTLTLTLTCYPGSTRWRSPLRGGTHPNPNPNPNPKSKQVGSVPTPSRRNGGYESVLTDEPEHR